MDKRLHPKTLLKTHKPDYAVSYTGEVGLLRVRAAWPAFMPRFTLEEQHKMI